MFSLSKSPKCVLFCILAILLPSPITPHGNGAPSNRCDSMEPGHWVSPQETLSPYQVHIDKTVITPGDRVNITLHTIRGQTGFKGFFVMVKQGDSDDVGTPAEGQGPNLKAYGQFDLARSDLKHSQPVHCFNLRNSAMTHVMNDVKNSIELFWIAPKLLSSDNKRNSAPYTERELKVVVTFVKDFWTVWTEVEPAGGVRLLLTDTHQLSPKFQQSQSQAVAMPSPSPSSPKEDTRMTSENIPLDDSSSWTHFKRAWNYMVDMFGSSGSSPTSFE